MVPLSSCEAEVIAASTTACQGVWLRRLLADLTKKEVQKVSLKIDNQAAISLFKNPVHHERSKHIDTRYHYIRGCIEEEMIEVQHVNTKDQLADILTKSLYKQKFIKTRKKVRVQEVTPNNKVKEMNVDGNLVGLIRVGVGVQLGKCPNRSRTPSTSGLCPNRSRTPSTSLCDMYKKHPWVLIVKTTKSKEK